MSEKNKSKGKPPVSKGATVAQGPMDVALLQQLVALMTSHDLNTVDLRDGNKRVVLKRGAVVAAAAPMMSYAPAPVATPPNSPAPSGGNASAPPAADDDEKGLMPIKSPMVGTFYSKPSPDAKPFVAVGSRVDEETDVCVVEAMKHFNPIKAETRGTIAKILFTDGQTVDFGSVLFLVKP